MMPTQYDPKTHHRRSIRLEGFNYAQEGGYFITICTVHHKTVLGQVQSDEVHLSPYGQIVEQVWAAIPDHFAGVQVDAFVVMPNHVHGIVIMGAERDTRRGEAFAAANASPLPGGLPQGTQSGSLSAIVQNLKSVTTRKINKARHTPGAVVWQRNYFERVIRHTDELNRIRKYIIERDRAKHSPTAANASPLPLVTTPET